MNFVTSISLVILGAMFLALLGWGSIRAAWLNCEGRRGVFAALAILAAVCSIVAQKPSPDTPTITVDALLRDVGCYATNNVFHAAVTNAQSYAGVDFSDCDLMVYARERASTNAASWFELTPRKKFSQQPADYAIENATNYNYMVYLNYVPPSPVHTNGVFELYGFVIENEAQGEPDQLAAGFINSRAVPLPFDAEVEYLEGGTVNGGVAFIDTGYTPNSSTRIEATAAPLTGSSYSGRFGNRSRVTFGAYQNTAYVAQGDHYYPGAIVYGRFYSFINDIPNRVVTVVDVGSKSTSAVSNWYPQLYPLYLFVSNVSPLSSGVIITGHLIDQNSIGGMRISSCRIYDNNVLVRDYISVRKGTVGYMYDRVSGQLFGNVGTGAFDVGPDK